MKGLLREFIRSLIKEAGAAAERQETGFVRLVNKHAKRAPKGITVISNDREVDKVTGAEKFQGRAASGSEPYTDIVIHTKVDNFNVSAKGPTAPSIAGGGLSGMEELVPGLIGSFLEAAEEWYLDNGYEAGDIIPDIYGQLNDEDKMTIVIGSEEIGGPIDLMYIGPMDVSGDYDKMHQELTVSGALIDTEDFADDHDIYLRLRKRRSDQPFVPGEKDSRGLPLILGKSPSRGDRGRRVVVTKQVPASANVVEF